MFKKFSKIAVLICGELRQFWRAAPSQFEYFRHFSDSVDYFLVTWDTTKDLHLSQTMSKEYHQVTESQILEIFKKQNLKEFRIVRKQDFEEDQNIQLLKSKGLMSNFFYRAYLAKIACELKNHHERISGKDYELVAEIRPDLWIKSRFFYEPILMTPMVPLADWQVLAPIPWQTLKICENLAKEDPSTPLHVPAMDDLYFISNSKVNNILSNRVNFRTRVIPYNDHRLMYVYLESNNLFILADIYGTVKDVIRPNIPEHFNFETQEIYEVDRMVRLYNDKWNNR